MTQKRPELTKLDKERLSLILHCLNTCKGAVMTPLEIAHVTGISYRAVLHILRKQRELQQWTQDDHDRLLDMYVGQYQTYWWSLERRAKIVEEYLHEIR